jgi:hypothetical protein
MTGQQIIDKFSNYVSDQLDADFALQLANDAKNAVETELQLEITKKLNSSGSVSAGQTYTTSRSLPGDFFLPLTIRVGTQKVYPVPFEAQVDYRESSGFYWVDLGSNVYYLTGTQGSAQTIFFFYQRATDDLTVSTSPIWPTQFHSLIPLEMARQYWMIDQGEKNRAWDDRFNADYQRMKRLMIDWDAKLKLHAMDNSAFLDLGPYPSENRINP